MPLLPGDVELSTRMVEREDKAMMDLGSKDPAPPSLVQRILYLEDQVAGLQKEFSTWVGDVIDRMRNLENFVGKP